MPAIARADDPRPSFRDDGAPRPCRSSAAAPAPASRRNARRPAASTSSSSTIPAATAWPAAARRRACSPTATPTRSSRRWRVEVLPVVKHTPVLAGVNGTDPFVLMPQFLAELKAMGFSGVQNFPTIGLFDGAMRSSFEETGMGYGLEVEMIAAAHAPRPADHALCLQPRRGGGDDRAPAPTSSSRTWASPPAARSAPPRPRSLDDCVGEIDAIAAAARAVRADVIVLCHGGPIAMPDGRRLRPEARRHLPRLLRRLEHGAPAGRGRRSPTRPATSRP